MQTCLCLNKVVSDVFLPCGSTSRACQTISTAQTTPRAGSESGRQPVSRVRLLGLAGTGVSVDVMTCLLSLQVRRTYCMPVMRADLVVDEEAHDKLLALIRAATPDALAQSARSLNLFKTTSSASGLSEETFLVVWWGTRCGNIRV